MGAGLIIPEGTAHALAKAEPPKMADGVVGSSAVLEGLPHSENGFGRLSAAKTCGTGPLGIVID